MNIDPRGLDVIEWCDYMVDELNQFGPVPRLLDPREWRAWGEVVIQFQGLLKYSPPEPRFFDEWREWAERFNQAVTL